MPVTINGSNTPTAGGVTYGDGTTYATTSAGSSGQALLSGGAGAPTWGTPASATSATNLAGGGAGQVPYQSGAGTTAFLAAGTSGQVLSSNGTSAPSWITPSSGALVYLTTLTASSSATLTYSGFSSTYDAYMVVISSLLPATNNVAIKCNPYTVANGAETNNYTAKYTIEGGTPSNSNGDGATHVYLASQITNSSTYRGLSGVVYYTNPKGANGYMQYWFQTASTAATSFYGQIAVGSGRAGSSLQYDGFQIAASSGNLASGTVRVYGIINS